jgi:hypothetical protein
MIQAPPATIARTVVNDTLTDGKPNTRARYAPGVHSFENIKKFAVRA